jgi:hypothetical protein
MECRDGYLTEVKADRICVACQDSPGLWEKPLINPSPNQQFCLLFSKLFRYYEAVRAACGAVYFYSGCHRSGSDTAHCK